jgi:TatD DNase family protein
MVPFTVRSMAETLAVGVNELATQLTANTYEVYGRWDDTPVSSRAAE